MKKFIYACTCVPLCEYVWGPVSVCRGWMRMFAPLEVVTGTAHPKSGRPEEQKLLITTEQCVHSLIWLSYCLYSFNLCAYMCWCARGGVPLGGTGHLWEAVLFLAMRAEGILTRPSSSAGKKLAEPSQQPFYFFKIRSHMTWADLTFLMEQNWPWIPDASLSDSQVVGPQTPSSKIGF